MDRNSSSSFDKAIQESPNSAQGTLNVYTIQYQHNGQLLQNLIEVEISKQQVQAKPKASNSQNKPQTGNDKPQTPKISFEENFDHHPGKKSEQQTKIDRKKPAQKEQGQQNQKKEQNSNQSSRIQSNSEALSSLQKPDPEKESLQRQNEQLKLKVENNQKTIQNMRQDHKKQIQSMSEHIRYLQKLKWNSSQNQSMKKDDNLEKSPVSELIATLNQYIERLQQYNYQGLQAQLISLKEIFWQKKQYLLQRSEKQKAAIQQPLLGKIKLLQEEVKVLKAVPASNYQKIRMIKAQERKINQLNNRIQVLQQQKKPSSQQYLEQIYSIRTESISPYPEQRLNYADDSNSQKTE